jgi:hypothetical protein
MNRILRRPMFRIGGSAGTGITSGLDQPQKMASAGMDMKLKKLTEAFMLYKQQGGTLSFEEFSELYAKENFNSGGRVGYKTGTMPTLQATGLPGFLTSFGLNMLATPPRGNIFQTAATAARDPFAQLQADQIAARRLQAEKEFLRSERLSTQEFEEGQLEKRLGVEREKIAAGDDFSLNQLTQLYMDNYAGDPNAQIKASNHAKYVKLILPELRTTVGDSQVGGVVEEDLSDLTKAKKFAKRNKNNVGKVFFDVNSGTLKKLVRDPDTKKLGFVPFSLTDSTQTGADDSNDFLPTKEGRDEVVPKKDILEEITTPGLTSTDQAILDQIEENKKKIQEGYKNIGQSDFSDLYR